MDPQLNQLYKYILTGWEVQKPSLVDRIKYRVTNKYKVTIYSPLFNLYKEDKSQYKLRLTLFLEPYEQKCERAMEVCHPDGTPQKFKWKGNRYVID